MLSWLVVSSEEGSIEESALSEEAVFSFEEELLGVSLEEELDEGVLVELVFSEEGSEEGSLDGTAELVPVEDELVEEMADEDELTCSPQENSSSDKATARMVLRDIFYPPGYALSIRARG